MNSQKRQITKSSLLFWSFDIETKSFHILTYRIYARTQYKSESINQPTHQLINQSINQSINRSIGRCQSIKITPMSLSEQKQTTSKRRTKTRSKINYISNRRVTDCQRINQIFYTRIILVGSWSCYFCVTIKIHWVSWLTFFIRI